jgi:hypothetical protein
LNGCTNLELRRSSALCVLAEEKFLIENILFALCNNTEMRRRRRKKKKI